MKTFKKIIAFTLAMAMVAAVSVGATVAYLQDEDSDVNVMTLGNVQIEQIELQRKDGIDYKNGGVIADGDELEAFEQGQLLFPTTYTNLSDYTAKSPNTEQFWWGDYVTADVSGNGSSNGLWDDNLTGAMDKFVFVKNTGKSDAYYRTLIAFECPEGMEYSDSYDKEFMMNVNLNSRFDREEVGYITVKDVRYFLLVFTYNKVLEPGTISRPSLLQVVMTHNATNEDMALLGDTYDILVLSQAVQTNGFADAATALDTAFGKVADNAATWFGDVSMPILVSSVNELQEAIDNAVDGDTIVLGSDITGDVTVTQKPNVKITIDGNGKEFAGVITVDGKSATYTTAGLTIKNVNFKADSISADACIRLGNGTNGTRYTCNVTVENCTFDVPGAVGVKSYTGGDKNLVITGCTATANAHSLAQLKGIDGVLVKDCDVNAVRGINFNNSNNITVIDTTIDVDKYAVRFGESGNSYVEDYAIINSTLTSKNGDGDAAIVLRAGATDANLTLENVTIIAGTEMSGHESANIITK